MAYIVRLMENDMMFDKSLHKLFIFVFIANFAFTQSTFVFYASAQLADGGEKEDVEIEKSDAQKQEKKLEENEEKEAKKESEQLKAKEEEEKKAEKKEAEEKKQEEKDPSVSEESKKDEKKKQEEEDISKNEEDQDLNKNTEEVTGEEDKGAKEEEIDKYENDGNIPLVDADPKSEDIENANEESEDSEVVLSEADNENYFSGDPSEPVLNDKSSVDGDGATDELVDEIFEEEKTDNAEPNGNTLLSPTLPEFENDSRNEMSFNEIGDDEVISPIDPIYCKDESQLTVSTSVADESYSDNEELDPSSSEKEICITNDAEITNQSVAVSDTGNNSNLPTEEADASTINNDAASTEFDIKEESVLENNPHLESDIPAVSELTETEIEQNHQEENPVTIETGDAISEAIIFNEINTNTIGENWNKLIYNIYGTSTNDINLLSFLYEIIDNGKNNNSSQSNKIDVILSNFANIQNTATAQSNTGNNKIEIPSSSDDVPASTIKTGDAFSYANIINLVNTNLLGNNWLFSNINVFGNWLGNLIVPGKNLLSSTNYTSDKVSSDIQINNAAQIENQIESSAKTGDNSAEPNSSIMTGNAVSQAVSTNIANTNTLKNNWFFLLINNMGTWSGNIIGLDGGDNFTGNSYSYDFSESENKQFNNFGNISIDNYADITNAASSTADTGANQITGSEGSIITGNATALSSVFNFINNNIIGSNWMFSMVNILGSWSGNVEFEYPDLSITIDDKKENAANGEILSYEISLSNDSYARADDVDVLISLSPDVTYISDNSGISHDSSQNNLVWNISRLSPNEKKEFVVTVKIDSDFPVGTTQIISAAGIRTSTTEQNMSDNSSSDITIVTILPAPVASDNNENTLLAFAIDDSSESDEDSLKLSRKEATVSVLPQGNIIRHTITLKNTGDAKVYNVGARDNIRNSNGDKIGKLEWYIGTIKSDEKVIIEYEILVGSSLGGNSFEHTALASGFATIENTGKVSSNKSSTTISLLAYAGSLGPIIDELTSIPTTEAFESADSDGAVLGQQNNGICPADRRIAPWIWIALLGIYALGMNRILLPKKRTISS